MNPNQQIQIKASDEDLKGRFTNGAQVFHQQDYFLLDFFMATPPVGQLVSRIIMSPGHAKRLAKAIEEQVKVYESTFGKIDATEEPPTIGFKTA